MQKREIFVFVVVVFLLAFGVVFLFFKPFFSEKQEQQQAVDLTPDSVSSQASQDTVIIKKDESENIVGKPAESVPFLPDESSEFLLSETFSEKFEEKKLFPVAIGIQTLRLELADSEYAQMRGLTGRAFLPQDQGMLYVVTKRQDFSYWAKDMRFSTDVIWVGQDFRIVDITKNVIPQSYPDAIFRSKEPARYVIEVNAGTADTTRVKIGDALDFSSILKK